MMGHSHALSGAVTGTALGIYLHATPAATVGYAVLGAAFATVPDLDTRSSCASRSLGFLSAGFAWVVTTIARGHRHGTHCLLGVAAFTELAVAATRYRHDWWGLAFLWLLLAVAFAAAARALAVGGHYGDLIGVGLAGGVAWQGWDLRLVPLGCAVGCATHIAGDMMTDEGAPLLWPLTGYHVKWWPEPIAFSTGTVPETGIVDPLLGAAFAVLAVWVIYPAADLAVWVAASHAWTAWA